MMTPEIPGAGCEGKSILVISNILLRARTPSQQSIGRKRVRQKLFQSHSGSGRKRERQKTNLLLLLRAIVAWLRRRYIRSRVRKRRGFCGVKRKSQFSRTRQPAAWSVVPFRGWVGRRVRGYCLFSFTPPQKSLETIRRFDQRTGSGRSGQVRTSRLRDVSFGAWLWSGVDIARCCGTCWNSSSVSKESHSSAHPDKRVVFRSWLNDGSNDESLVFAGIK